jgi:hypothetical protein
MPREEKEGVRLGHGATHLPAVDVLSYNVELKDDQGFVGDRASKGAFKEFFRNCAESSGRIFLAEANGSVIGFVCVLGKVLPSADDGRLTGRCGKHLQNSCCIVTFGCDAFQRRPL